jgi:hypothetical protein
MVYSFYTLLNQAETCEAIKKAVTSIGGTTHDISPYVFTGKWRSVQHPTIFPQKFTFYVGSGIVRAVSDGQDMQVFAMRLRLQGYQTIWNRFIEALLQICPQCDFGLEPGDLELVAVEFLGDATEQVYVTTTKHTPSLAGAIIGGELFGTVGAIVGGCYGSSQTTVRSSTRYTNYVLAQGRYSNGLLVQGKILRNSSIYHEILANMNSLSPSATAPLPPSAVTSNLRVKTLSLEEKNALKSALSYAESKFFDFSRKQFIEQLEFEGYSTAAATKVVDSLSVDWNAQAAASAKSYMESKYLSYSRTGLLEQLEYEGFTKEQAEFGVTSVGY